CPSVHISAQWFLDSARWPFLWTLWVILAHVGCLFNTHRTSVGVRQHTQDIRGCPRPWVSISTHRTSLAVHKYTHGICGCMCVSVCVRQHTHDVCVCPSVHISARWSLDSALWPFPWTVRVILAHVGCLVSTHRTTSVGVRQLTQDVRGCPWLSVSTHRMSVCVRVCLCVTHRTSVAVHQHTHDIRGCPCVSVCVRQHTQDIRGLHTGCPWVSASTHMTSVAVRLTHMTSVAVRVCPCVYVGVRQHTQDVRGCQWLLGDFGPLRLSVEYTQDVCGCPPSHTGRPWLSVCVRLCSSAHTRRPWLSISTHIRTLVLGLSTLALPVDCLVHTGHPWVSASTHMTTSVGVRQHTQDVCGHPPAHTGRPWLSASTHRTSVDVLVCPCVFVSTHMMSGVRGCPSVHISARWSLDSALWPFPWTVWEILSSYTQDVRGCPPAHTGRLWLSISTHRTSVAVRVCPSAHTRRSWLSISTHISTLVLGLSTLTFPWTVRVILAHVGCLFSTHRTSVGVRQHTHDDVRGCPPAHTGRLWLSVAV
ncbi:unnamed protein product, partial [Brassica rapa]